MNTDDITDAEIEACWTRGQCAVCLKSLAVCRCVCVICGRRPMDCEDPLPLNLRNPDA